MPNSIVKLISFFIVFLLVAESPLTFAQTSDNPIPASGSDNSPYSQFGIGTLSLPPNAALRGMGGIGAAFTDAWASNPENPASYSFLQYTAFAAGFETKSRIVSYEGRSPVNSFTGNMAYINIAFPIKKFGALAFGLNPVSNIYYRLSDTIAMTSQDQAARTFFGDGGLQNGYVGLSAKIKGFSIGANLGYTFGKVDRVYTLSTLKLASIRNFEDITTTHYGGVNWNAGALYQVKMKNQMFLNLGVTYSASPSLSARRNGNSIARTYGVDPDRGGLLVINLDTIRKYDNDKGKLTLPSSWGAGIHFGKLESFDVNIDFKISDWSLYSHYGLTDSIRSKTMMLGIGGSYTPDASALYSQNSNYFSAVTFRAGFYYHQDYVYLRNTDINEIGGAFGMSFPLRRTAGNYQLGKINAMVNVGSRGTLQNGLAREVFFNLTIGASLTDLWFIKPVYE